MDDFKQKATTTHKDPHGEWYYDKKFGRKAARRSIKQTNWIEQFNDVIYESGWEFGGMFYGDYDYYDDLDIYEEILDWVFDNKESLGFTYGSGD